MTFVYTYAGRPLTDISNHPGLTPENFISASLTFQSSLPANMDHEFTVPLTWLITDGVHTLTNSTPGVIVEAGNFNFSTDASGAIVAPWIMNPRVECIEGSSTNIGTQSGPNECSDMYNRYDALANAYNSALNRNDSGTWTTSNSTETGDPA